MSYHNAKATKFLATHCAACGRELVDSTSVEQGMGPHCRKNYYNDAPDVTEEIKVRVKEVIDGIDNEDIRQRVQDAVNEEHSRKAGNILVHYVAHHQTTEESFPAIRVLKALKFDKLAKRIEDRLGPDIEISVSEDRLVVKTPYHEKYVADIKTVPGRRYDPETKSWSIPRNPTSKLRLWAILLKNFEGCLAIGPKGPFTVSR